MGCIDDSSISCSDGDYFNLQDSRQDQRKSLRLDHFNDDRPRQNSRSTLFRRSLCSLESIRSVRLLLGCDVSCIRSIVGGCGGVDEG